MTQTIRGRQYSLYFSGSKLHLVAFQQNGASYWVVNTLLDRLSNAPAELTLVAAVATAVAVERATGLAAQIKWPNDVVVEGRKVGGALAEAYDWRAVFLFGAIATAVMFVASIFTPWAVVWGAVPVAIGLIGWFWPTREETRKHQRLERAP